MARREASVLTEFKLDEGEEEFLKIKGRTPGLIGWVLSVLGIDAVTSLTCNRKSIRFEEASIRVGKNTINIPLTAVSAVSSGIDKPFAILCLGAVSIILGFIIAIFTNSFGLFMLGLAIGAGFLILYKLKKNMSFGIFCGGDKPIAVILMKKSIIEGQDIDESRYEAAATALFKAVMESRSKGGQG